MKTLAPKSIRQLDETTLGISWSDGHESNYSVKNLRESCPCAHCIDEWSGKKLIAPGTITEAIRPRNLKAVGLYAIQFDWSDGHDTGLYTHELLRQLCECSDCKND
tara:strand:+ start:207 stop:524 length:318 start_codon:yes stop_codon:yes gene_type:complete